MRVLTGVLNREKKIVYVHSVNSKSNKKKQKQKKNKNKCYIQMYFLNIFY